MQELLTVYVIDDEGSSFSAILEKVLMGLSAQFIAKHVEEEWVMRRDDSTGTAVRPCKHLDQMVGHHYGVVLIQRRDRVVYVDEPHPSISFRPIKHQLDDG